MVTKDLFDRCINLYFFDVKGGLLDCILTPSAGVKPDILVETQLLGLHVDIDTRITVTNMTSKCALDAIEYIGVQMYYGGQTSSVNGGFIGYYTVMWADESKQPPDRQTVFECRTSGVSDNVMQHTISISSDCDSAKGTKVQVTFDSVAKQLIAEYNKWVTKFASITSLPVSAAFSNILQLSSEVVYDTPDIGLTMVEPWEFHGTIVQAMDELKALIKGKEKLSEGEDAHYYDKYNVFISNSKLYVGRAPTTEMLSLASSANGADAVPISHVIYAYRRANIIHCALLFDERINIGTLCTIKGALIMGRKQKGGVVLLMLPDADYYFKPIASIKVKFGTVRENRMELIGSLYSA